MLKKLLLTSLALAISPTLWAQTTVIHAGTLLADTTKQPLTQQTIIIKDDKITDIKAGFINANSIDENANFIDLSSDFVMPGMMDMHVHLQGELGPKNDSQNLRLSDADVLMQSVKFAHSTLKAGFTTVRDLGAKPEQMHALRDAINKHWLPGPRIISATTVGVTGGHMDVSGMKPDLLKLYTPETVCDGPYDCRRAVRHAIKFGADWIKIASTGGVLTDNNTGTGQQMTEDELAAVVETAHSLGRKVASHAHAAQGINAALRAGVDSIEHGSYCDNECIKLLKQTKAYLVPTLLAGDTVVSMAKNSDFMSPAIKQKALRVGSDMLAHFSKAYKAGVNVAFGTDSGVSHHGDNAKEALLMKQAGMKNSEIIQAATINSAKLLGMEQTLGSIEQGKIADIIAMKQNPLNDISALTQVNFVMTSGEVVK